MEAGNNRIRLCQALSMRPPRFTNECRDVHSPIGSCDDSCDIRISSQGGESFDSTDDLSYSNREDLSGSGGHQHQLLIWDGVRRDLYSLMGYSGWRSLLRNE